MVKHSKILWLAWAGASVVGAVVANSQQAPIRVGPEVVDAAESGIGRLVRGVSGDTISGSTFSLETAPEAKGYVIAMTDLTCPVTRKFAPTLAALEERFSDQGIVFIFVNVIDFIVLVFVHAPLLKSTENCHWLHHLYRSKIGEYQRMIPFQFDTEDTN